MHTRFILIRPSHAGNVGAVARAMKVMGFDDLVLLQPRWSDVLTRPEAIERASGADDVLRRARIVHSWGEAVAGIQHLCATAMTVRDFGPPTSDPRSHFAALAQRAAAGAPSSPSATARHPQHMVDYMPSAHVNQSMQKDTLGKEPALHSVGLVFGCERYGMSNQDVYRCHACLRIPTNPAYGSLNLAAAAQVLAYEWRMALGGFEPCVPDSTTHQPLSPQTAGALADAAAVEGVLAHWQQVLEHIGYLNPASPKKLIPRLRRLLFRASLREEEVHILRGMARQINKAIQPHPTGTDGVNGTDSADGAASPERHR